MCGVNGFQPMLASRAMRPLISWHGTRCNLHRLLRFRPITGTTSGEQSSNISSPWEIPIISLASQRDLRNRRQHCCTASERAQQRPHHGYSRWASCDRLDLCSLCAVIGDMHHNVMCCPKHDVERTEMLSAVRKLAAPHNTLDHIVFPRGHWILRKDVSRLLLSLLQETELVNSW